MAVSLAGVPVEISNLIQDRTLERVFHDSLFPRLLFRSEAMPEMWPVNLGERMVFTRAGLIPVSTVPLIPGEDPAPSQFAYEQWEAEARQFGDTIDTHMPTSYVSLAPIFLRNTVQLGLNAGETLNRLVRDRLYRAYLGGQTTITASVGANDPSISVSSLNGFTEVLVDGRPTPVGPSAPLGAQLGVDAGGLVSITIVGAVPDDVNQPFGPGTLSITPQANTIASLGTEDRPPVLADNRSRIIRVGGGNSSDAITTGDILTLDTVISATARLRAARVPPQSDGYYHIHLSPEGEAQIFGDPHWQRLYTALPDSMAYRELAIGQMVGCRFYRNTETPNPQNSETLIPTNDEARTSSSVGGEIFNRSGVSVQRAIVIGGGAVYEKYLDESKYITEAGVTGKIGQFTVVNNGVQVMTNRIRYILRAPLDRLQQVVSQSWSWSGDFPIPSDAETFDSSRFKRAVIIEHG